MMGSWSDWLTAGIGTWVIKGVAALGLGVVTYKGWDFVKGQLDSAISGAVGSMGADVYKLVSLAGFIDAIGIWLGAMTAAVVLLSFKKLSMLNS